MAVKDAAQTWVDFLSGFGLPVYDENTVPEDASLPRLTYSWSESELDAPVTLSANLWYRSKSWAAITQKAEQIFDTVGYGGKVLPITGGYIWVTRGTAFSQRITDQDDGIRRILLNFTLEFLRV